MSDERFLRAAAEYEARQADALEEGVERLERKVEKLTADLRAADEALDTARGDLKEQQMRAADAAEAVDGLTGSDPGQAVDAHAEAAQIMGEAN